MSADWERLDRAYKAGVVRSLERHSERHCFDREVAKAVVAAACPPIDVEAAIRAGLEELHRYECWDTGTHDKCKNIARVVGEAILTRIGRRP